MTTHYKNCEVCGETFTSRYKTSVSCRKCNRKSADKAWKERIKNSVPKKENHMKVKRKSAKVYCDRCREQTTLEYFGDYGFGKKGKCVTCKSVQSWPGYEKEKNNPVTIIF